MRRDANSCVYIDKGADQIGMFTVDIDVKLEENVATSLNYLGLWAVSNTQAATNSDIDAANSGITLGFLYTGSYALEFKSWSSNDAEHVSISLATTYYVRIKRDATTLKFCVYTSSAARTTDAGSYSSITMTETLFRYMNAGFSREGSTNGEFTMSAKIENLKYT
jgi:hypothetical protein